MLRHLSSTVPLSVAVLAASAGLSSAQQQLALLPTVDGARGEAQPANVKPGPMPLSETYGVKLGVTPAISVGEINNEAYWAQDLDDRANGRESPIKRVSIEVPVNFNWALGQWHDVPEGAGGGRLWVLDVVSPTAWGVRTHFSNFDLPQGVQMTVYAPNDLDSAPWPYEAKGRRGAGEFWARTAFSNTARVEVYVPRNVIIDEARPMFSIDKIHHWYINMSTGTPSAFQTNEIGCHRDVSCEPGWANPAAGVCRLYFNGGLCSASILNTFASDWTPYLYTAAHCFNTQATADALETYWFYQTASCNGAAPAIPSGINRADDATLISTGGVADHTFVMIEGAIRRDLWWQGWDPNPVGNGTTAVGIHHPDGSYKRFSSSTVTSPNLSCNIAGIGAGIRGNWNVGVTEPGSSGSPMFDGAARVRGALSCATWSCAAGATNYFYYGPLSVAYPNFSSFLNGGSDDGIGDNCATATVVTTGAGSGAINNLIVKSVNEDWFSFVVPAGGAISAGTNFIQAWGDVDLQLQDGCTGTVLTSSTGTGNSETVTWNNTTGSSRTVTLRVYLFNDTRANYNMNFNVSAPTPPSNDTCGSATPLQNGLTAIGSNVGATNDGVAVCTTTNSDVYYRFFAPCSTSMTVTTAGSDFDTVLTAFDACPSSGGVALACNDDFNNTLQSEITFNITGGQTYYLRVASFGTRAQGNISINATIFRPWSNDDCPASVSLPAGSFGFDTCAATTSGPFETLCGRPTNSFQADFWNDFTAPSNGTLTVNTFGSSIDTMLAVYAFCPTAQSQALACNDDAAFTLQSQVSVPVTALQNYKIRTGGYFGAAGPGTLNIIFTPDGPVCGSIDFNGDGLFPDDSDLIDFLSVLAGGPCSTGTCGSIDFNGDGLFPDDNDLIAFLRVLAGGEC
jgi:hypothetical protein